MLGQGFKGLLKNPLVRAGIGFFRLLAESWRPAREWFENSNSRTNLDFRIFIVTNSIV
jgi:hypothetical protein